MDYLVSVTDLKVFGCSIDFHADTPEDSIWDKLQQSTEYTKCNPAIAGTT